MRDERSHPGYGFAVEGLAFGLSANVHVRLARALLVSIALAVVRLDSVKFFFSLSSRQRAHRSDSWRNTACQSEGKAYQRCPFADGDSLLPIVCIATIQNNAAPLCKSASLGEFSR